MLQWRVGRRCGAVARCRGCRADGFLSGQPGSHRLPSAAARPSLAWPCLQTTILRALQRRWWVVTGNRRAFFPAPAGSLPAPGGGRHSAAGSAAA